MQNLNPFDKADLISKHLRGESLTSVEQAALDLWIDQNKELWDKLSDAEYVENQIEYYWNKNKKESWDKIHEQISNSKTEVHYNGKKGIIRNFRLGKIAKYAAAITLFGILSLFAGQYLKLEKGKDKEFSFFLDKSVDSLKRIGPAVGYRGHSATLILATGEIINLSSKDKNLLAEKDGILLQNIKNQLTYIKGQDSDGPAAFHTLIIPRGNTYQLKLSDGTDIWLNSGSTIRFPTKFDEKSREVFLSGEAYFDVAHQAQHPFIVKTQKMNITVLGTTFNVSSYPDEPEQKTTLFKGSVKVNELVENKAQKEILLKPGYEVVIKKESSEVSINKLKEIEAPSWRNNLLAFNNEGFGNIMRRLGREYNVDITYAHGVDTTLHYTGRIKMGEEINDLLERIELIGKVRFALDSNRLLVLPASNSKK